MKQYIIDKPKGCECWYLWEGDRERVIAVGTLEKVAEKLKQRGDCDES